MNRAAVGVILFAILMIFGSVAAYIGYANTIYALDRANGLFSRAETAGFAEDLITYVARARLLLPQDGNPVWIFPTDKTDFREIQADIDGILARARLIQSLPKDSDEYQSGMDDLRGKVRTLQSQVSDAAPYMFVSVLNIGLSIIWTLGQIGIILFLIRASIRRRGRSRRKRKAIEISE